MKESPPRFLAPISSPRPRGSRLLTAFSPEIVRTVRAVDHAGFDQWIRLEADLGVNAFCEHPRRVGSGDEGPLASNTWVQRAMHRWPRAPVVWPRGLVVKSQPFFTGQKARVLTTASDFGLLDTDANMLDFGSFPRHAGATPTGLA